MKQVILHIGLQKTGSKSFQNSIKFLEDPNFGVFTIKNRNNKKDKFIKEILEYLDKPNILRKNEIKKKIQSLNAKKIFISCEDIFGHPSNVFKDAKKRFRILENLFYKPIYIIFIREPSEIIFSSYMEGLKSDYQLDLTFAEYSNKKIIELKNSSKTSFKFGTNYRIYNYNLIFKDYLKLKKRVHFIFYNDLFKKKGYESLFKKILPKEFKINLKKNNVSPKYLIYFNHYKKNIIINKLFKFLIYFFRVIIKFSHKKNLIFYINLTLKIIYKLDLCQSYKVYEMNIHNTLHKIKVFNKDKFKNFRKNLKIKSS